MNNQTDNRIKLAEAMYLDYGIKLSQSGEPIMAAGSRFDLDRAIRNVPDPFTDANDDYRVLVWAIKNIDPDKYFAAISEVVGSYCYMHEYRIGYFATAALAVLKEGE